MSSRLVSEAACGAEVVCVAVPCACGLSCCGVFFLPLVCASAAPLFPRHASVAAQPAARVASSELCAWLSDLAPVVLPSSALPARLSSACSAAPATEAASHAPTTQRQRHQQQREIIGKRRKPGPLAMRFDRLLLCTIIARTLLLCSLAAVAASTDDGPGCWLPSADPLINRQLGSGTTCNDDPTTPLAAGSSCVIECTQPAQQRGAARFQCDASGAFFDAQQQCVPSFAPSAAVTAATTPYYSLPLPSASAHQPLQRDYLSAQEQLRRHRAAKTNSSISGWRTAMLAGNDGTMLWLTTDGASWVGRAVPSMSDPPATLLVDSIGRITALFSLASDTDPGWVGGDLRVLQSNENLTSWRSLGTATSSGTGRYGYAVAQLPNQPNACVWAAGSINADYRNDV